jgi:hypothetical protein
MLLPQVPKAANSTVKEVQILTEQCNMSEELSLVSILCTYVFFCADHSAMLNVFAKEGGGDRIDRLDHTAESVI